MTLGYLATQKGHKTGFGAADTVRCWKSARAAADGVQRQGRSSMTSWLRI